MYQMQAEYEPVAWLEELNNFKAEGLLVGILTMILY